MRGPGVGLARTVRLCAVGASTRTGDNDWPWPETWFWLCCACARDGALKPPITAVPSKTQNESARAPCVTRDIDPQPRFGRGWRATAGGGGLLAGPARYQTWYWADVAIDK